MKNSDRKSDKKVIIGFSQCTMIDEWRKTMISEMKREINFYRDYDIDFIVKDANDDNQKQIKDIKDLAASKIDILIVSPNEAEQLTPIVEEVYNKGIPVIIIDRKINSSKYTAYIGADNLAVGKEAGYFAAELLKGKGKVLEITGLTGSTPAIERSQGFREIIQGFPGIKIEKSVEGDWLEKKALNLTDSLFRSYSDFDLIFAQNDFMANAASKSARKNNIKSFIIGVDGLTIPEGGVALTLNHSIDGTIYYPTGGDKAIQLAMDIIRGKPYPKNNELNTFRIDHSNARTLWLQGLQLRDQQMKIDKQVDQLDRMVDTLNKQHILLFFTVSTIILLILTIAIVFLSLRNQSRMNKVLDQKNKTIKDQNQIITKQRDDSLNLLIVAEEARENKLQLFTDLSHEFRTVVTLMTSPMQEILNTTNDEKIKNKLKILQRSTERLARLTDSILKFRKIDENKYRLSFLSANITDFILNIIDTFQETASKKDIKIKSEISGEIFAEFDFTVIEKVMYNLLSNAIKYTNVSGQISVSLNSESSMIIIKVEDNGIGIPKAELPFLFNRFYKVNTLWNETENERMGIGLALCKELIQLHGGQISVDSIENTGTCFTITIPQFHIHSKNIPDKIAINNDNPVSPHKGKTILIVEDNPDLLIVISDIVGKYYNIITASNGREGLETARRKLPDLILSDILMPEMDGMQMCIEIKEHQLTCHIPIVLLTAIDSQDSAIKSFNIGADAYITKPFNEYYLLSNIKSLLETREKLKEYFCPSPFIRNLLQMKDLTDGEFVKECLNNIYENIDNENFTLDNLSDTMSMSRSSLYRKIKSITSHKPVDFIKKAKLNYAAKLLLTNTNLPVNEISWRSGFSDTKYFSKCFIQEFGINPSLFPKKYQKGKEENSILQRKDFAEA